MKLAFIVTVLGITLLGITSSGLLRDQKPMDRWSPKKSYIRVVSLAPSMSDTMVALEESNRVVGATIHCQNSQIGNARKIGSFAEPNFEAILALDPDLVLAVPHIMAKSTLDQLRANHIEVFAHQPDSLADIKYINLTIARKLGVEDKGILVNLAIDRAMLLAKKSLEAVSPNRKLKTALIAVAPTPFVVAGKTTFASEVVEAMGLINLASEKFAAWPVWPLEQLLVSPPDVLILSDGSLGFEKYQEIFRALGLDVAKTKMRIVTPNRPIFGSPSAEVIKDASYLTQLLQEGI
jgi:iron complex transport system substrate-binding protein